MIDVGETNHVRSKGKGRDERRHSRHRHPEATMKIALLIIDMSPQADKVLSDAKKEPF